MIHNQPLHQGLLASITDESPFVKYHKIQGNRILQNEFAFVSSGSSGFNTTIYPSSNHIIDRRMLVEAQLSFTSSVTTEAAGLYTGAPRSHPLMSVCQNLTISVNGNSSSTSPRTSCAQKPENRRNFCATRARTIFRTCESATGHTFCGIPGGKS